MTDFPHQLSEVPSALYAFTWLGLNMLCETETEPLVFEEEEVAVPLLFRVLDGIELVNSRSEVVGISSEGDVQGFEEFVHADKQRLRAVT